LGGKEGEAARGREMKQRNMVYLNFPPRGCFGAIEWKGQGKNVQDREKKSGSNRDRWIQVTGNGG